MHGGTRGATALLLTIAVVLASGCHATIPDGRYSCGATADCPPGFVCGGGGLCYRSVVDAGSVDLGPDARVDLGRADLGPDVRLDLGDVGDAGPCVCPPDMNPCTDDVCVGGGCTHPATTAGATCGENATCVGSTCTCTAPWERCGTATCSVDTSVDQANCGLCNLACPMVTPRCTGGLCAAGCLAPSDCVDALSCTADACNPGTGLCTHMVISGGCAIAGACVGAMAANSANPCQVCAPVASDTTWTARGDGTGCDDGLICNGVDTCQGGDCSHPGLGCVFTCSEPGGCCGEGGEPCCPGGTCSSPATRACYGGTSGTCMACGAPGGQCCGPGARPAGSCSPGYDCVDDTTGNGVCE